MGDFSLKCFGTGDGWPSAARGHSAFLYRVGGAALLVDCGEPVSSRYCASGLPWDLVDAIAVSHLHFDHVGGLFMLLQAFWVEGRTKDLTVFVRAGAIAPIEELLRAACLLEEVIPFRLRFTPWRPRQPHRVGALHVTPFPTTHLAPLQRRLPDKDPALFQVFSFLIESEGIRIGHTADIGAPADLAPLLEKPLDLLVCELAHAPPEAMFAFLKGRQVKRVVFVHLAREVRARLEEVRALAKTTLAPIDATFAEDGDEIL